MRKNKNAILILGAAVIAYYIFKNKNKILLSPVTPVDGGFVPDNTPYNPVKTTPLPAPTAPSIIPINTKPVITYPIAPTTPIVKVVNTPVVTPVKQTPGAITENKPAKILNDLANKLANPTGYQYTKTFFGSNSPISGVYIN